MGTSFFKFKIFYYIGLPDSRGIQKITLYGVEEFINDVKDFANENY